MQTLDAHPFNPASIPGALRIIPMGGCGEFGMNLTAYIASGKLFVVDAGVRFPEPERLGVDAIVPAVDPWFQAIGGVHAYIITHAHEDHLGAVPHLLPKWPAPVYGTAWTIELLRLKLTKLGHDPKSYTLVTVEPGDHVTTAGFDAEYIHVNHSIPMTCCLFIRTPGLNVFHTGDFKFEEQPMLEAATDFAHLKKLGDEGVDLLLTDSTNADKDGHCPGEATVFEPLKNVVESCEGAAIITTFASNLWRLKTIADVCIATGRKLYISGNGIETTLTIAKKLNLYHLPESLRVAEDQVAAFPRQRLVILATGCQGEWRSALARMAAGTHRSIVIGPGDTIIWSSRMIPGNEKAVFAMTNSFLRAGAKIITGRDAPDIHVSGHAFGGDVERLVQTLRPRHFLPVHGSFTHMRANLGRPLSAGMDATSTLIENGDVLDVSRQGVVKAGKIDIELEFVDSEAGVLISQGTLRDRLKVGELGMALVDGVFDHATNDWRIGPNISLSGLSLPLVVNSDDWLAKTARQLGQHLRPLLTQHQPPVTVTEEARLFVRRQLTRLLRKKPVVLVKLHIL